MQFYDPLCHTVTAEIKTAADPAFRFLSDPLRLGDWALGCRHTRPVENASALYCGTSIFDQASTYVSIDADPKRRLIDYRVGDSPDSLLPRISTRIIAGPDSGRPENCCLVSMSAWRPCGQDDTRWHRLCTTHDTEILLIKALLERSRDA